MLLDSDPLLSESAAVVAQVGSQVVSSVSVGAKTRGKWGGSKKGKAPNIDRDFVGAHKKLVHHYFSGPQSLYDETHFERRFRLKRDTFNRIWNAVNGNHPFVQQCDAAKKPGIHPLCRFVACLRVLAHGNSADSCDECLQISESVTNESLKHFCQLIVEKFGPNCLNRCPTPDEVRGLMKKMTARGFPGCFASWDCKHFDWASCPVRMQGQHKNGKEKKKTIVLEAIADADHCIWHVFFGCPGAMNDINILDKSPILGAIHRGSLNIHVDECLIDDKHIDHMYFLVDGIYPDLAYFVKTLNNTIDEKERFFCKVQEGERKAVECAFGDLVKKWHFLKNPLRNWHLEDIDMVVKTCVIFHNMIVEDRRGCLTDHVDSGDQLFRRLVLESEVENGHAPAQEMPAAPESAHAVESFSFLGHLVQDTSNDVAASTSREEISMALSNRIHRFIQHTENPHLSHALHMALINHVWAKKKRITTEERQASVRHV